MAAENGAVEMEKTADVQAPPAYSPPTVMPTSYTSVTYHQSAVPQPDQPVPTVAPTPQVTYVRQVAPNQSQHDILASIPVMPMGWAVTCCVLNTMIPGFGSILGSFSVFCCGSMNQLPQNTTKCNVFCFNFWIGWCQLLTCWFFFAGWIWSIVWGYNFIINSARYDERRRMQVTTVVSDGVVSITVSPDPTRNEYIR